MDWYFGDLRNFEEKISLIRNKHKACLVFIMESNLHITYQLSETFCEDMECKNNKSFSQGQLRTYSA